MYIVIWKQKNSKYNNYKAQKFDFQILPINKYFMNTKRKQ